ncbi:hypothetical protein CRUP_005644 [Coryphaenoides rupestris]|nr:hypothetical protein CRUP_005644 [Coryphaenoides rupestris]
MTTNSLTTCCESTGRSIADNSNTTTTTTSNNTTAAAAAAAGVAAAAAAAAAQTPVYCPVYESRLLATARHELSSAAALGVYGSPYGTSCGQGYGNYVAAYGTDASAFYSLFLMTTNSLTTCCESTGRSIADNSNTTTTTTSNNTTAAAAAAAGVAAAAAAAAAQTPVYCPVYESRLLATARHELSSAAALGVYGSPYGTSCGQGYGNYVAAYGTDASAFYSLGAFDTKDATGSTHTGITQAAAYYPYDPTLGQYQYDRSIADNSNTTTTTTSNNNTAAAAAAAGVAAAAAAAAAQTPVYCPVYESRLLATARHELSSAAALGVYGSPYGTSCGQGYGNYVAAYGTDASAFYSLGAFDTKDATGSTHTGITQAAAYYPYDPTLGQYQYDRYGSMDGSTRRKNATRETTSTLKAWLQEHRKNPYPTKGEKIMLAIITKMTLTQVSTWFANARRRLKKENKMTWPPRNKGSDDKRYDEDEEEEEDEGSLQGGRPKSENHEDAEATWKTTTLWSRRAWECELKHSTTMNTHMTTTDCPGDHIIKDASLKLSIPVSLGGEPVLGSKSCLKSSPDTFDPHNRQQAKMCYQQQQQQPHQQPQGHQIIDGKPRIWSLAQTATSLNQSEYSSCMLRFEPPSPAATSPVRGPLDRQDSSPVTTLRNWVDGVFHDPLFRHGSLNQALTNSNNNNNNNNNSNNNRPATTTPPTTTPPPVSWSNPKGAPLLETSGDPLIKGLQLTMTPIKTVAWGSPKLSTSCSAS